MIDMSTSAKLYWKSESSFELIEIGCKVNVVNVNPCQLTSISIQS